MDPTPTEPDLLCPNCGYNLRAAVEGRCSECGLSVDLSQLRHSGIPWAFRHGIGHVRAYVATVWRISFRSRSLQYEAAKPQNSRDGQSFARVTGALLAITFLMLFSWLMIENDGWASLAVRQTPATTTGGWRIDLAVPWSAGAVIKPVIPICLLLLGLFFAHSARPVFRLDEHVAGHRSRAEVLAIYAVAPLAMVFVTGILGVLTRVLPFDAVNQKVLPAQTIKMLIASFAAVLAGLATLLALARAGQWFKRVTHCSLGREIFAAVELLLRWIVGAVVIVGLLPWCVGFFWIVIDSLR